MNKSDATQVAIGQLNTVLTQQSNLLSFAGPGTDSTHGKRAAEFCISFIETYSAWLEKNG